MANSLGLMLYFKTAFTTFLLNIVSIITQNVSNKYDKINQLLKDLHDGSNEEFNVYGN